MKLLLTSLSFSLLLSPLCLAKEHSILSEADAKIPAIPLFNGKDLSGWSVKGGDGNFEVKDGVIWGHGKNVNKNTFLTTEKRYRNFVFSYKIKFVDRTGNSGVMFRANTKPTKDLKERVYGYQCEGDNTDRNWTAGLFDEFRRKWLFPKKTDTPSDTYWRESFTRQGARLIKWDDWNSIVIRCEGNRIQTWLNGELRVNFTDTDPEHDTREGVFGLQVHQGESCSIMWKDLLIRELPDG